MGCPWLSVRRSTVSERQPNQKNTCGLGNLRQKWTVLYFLILFSEGITCCRYFQVQWNLKLFHKNPERTGHHRQGCPWFSADKPNRLHHRFGADPRWEVSVIPMVAGGTQGGRADGRGSVMWGGGPSPETKRKVPKNGWFPIGISWISRGKPPFSGAFCCYFQGGGSLHLL